ncbi:hypothetical protein BLA29_009163 [Euroglyphus maynei]|uniref:Secreted protein n=1 Tax=Euroglyphus maynei TaxID=6958 RepID=A0A1Y3BK99_EURMA|nr:hypothetical protein BLA29_009163 [Euroglyphus maynei]
MSLLVISKLLVVVVTVESTYRDRYGEDRIESIELIRLDVVIDVVVVLVVVIAIFDEFIVKGPVEPGGTLYLETELVAEE